MRGDRRISRKTPALTIVEECKRALVGVGATMAPSNHVWKGIWAALVSAAKASSASGSMARLAEAPPRLTKVLSSRVCICEPM